MKKVSKVLGFSPPKKAAKIALPVPEKIAPVTPIPDEDAINLAAKKGEAMRQRSGRSSTLLTDDDNLG
jgi:hypothetical protein